MEYPIAPVFDVPEFDVYRTDTYGQCNAPDEKIAEYCGDNQLTLVTLDSDFRGQWVRTGLLKKFNVEVVVFPEIQGLPRQVERVVKAYPHWQERLTKYAPGFRVWTHDSRSSLPQLNKKASGL